MLKEVIGGISYNFDTNECVMMYKRFRRVYGDDFKFLAPQEQFVSDHFWDRAIPTEQEIREIEIENFLISFSSQSTPSVKLATFFCKNGNCPVLIIFNTSIITFLFIPRDPIILNNSKNDGKGTNSTLAGKPAYTLIGTYQDPSAGLQKLMEIGMIIGDKAYSVQYIADAPRYTNYLPTLQRMIQSLVISSRC